MAILRRKMEVKFYLVAIQEEYKQRAFEIHLRADSGNDAIEKAIKYTTLVLREQKEAAISIELVGIKELKGYDPELDGLMVELKTLGRIPNNNSKFPKN